MNAESSITSNQLNQWTEVNDPQTEPPLDDDSTTNDVDSAEDLLKESFDSQFIEDIPVDFDFVYEGEVIKWDLLLREKKPKIKVRFFDGGSRYGLTFYRYAVYFKRVGVNWFRGIVQEGREKVVDYAFVGRRGEISMMVIVAQIDYTIKRSPILILDQMSKEERDRARVLFKKRLMERRETQQSKLFDDEMFDRFELSEEEREAFDGKLAKQKKDIEWQRFKLLDRVIDQDERDQALFERQRKELQEWRFRNEERHKLELELELANIDKEEKEFEAEKERLREEASQRRSARDRINEEIQINDKSGCECIAQ